MGQQSELNQASLKSNTHKTRLCIDLLTKNVATRGWQEPSPVYLLGAMIQYLLTQFCNGFRNITTANNKNQL